MGEGSVVRVAAIQWAPPSAPTLDALAASLHEPLQRAVRDGAQLIVFAPGVDQALAAFVAGKAKASRKALDADAESAQAEAPEVRWFAESLSLGAELSRRFDALGRALARQYRVTLALGSVLVPVHGGPRRIAYLYGPQGDQLGSQAQTHRSPAERALGLARGAALKPIATPVGRVGLLSGADVCYPEASRILCLQGAEILVHQAMLAHWNEAVALSRLWREVQANQVFGIEAYSVAEGCRGRSAIHCPVEMAPDRSGWLARAESDSGTAVVCADLDEGRRKQVTAEYPIALLRNAGLYRRYFPGIYERSREHAGD